MDKTSQKERLREELLNKRTNLSDSHWTELSEKIISRLRALSLFKQAGTIHCYVSMNQRKEVNTHPLIKDMLAAGKQVVVPVTHPEEGVLTHLTLNDFNDLVPNEWGVPEPESGEEVTEAELDLVIIPMVGGDEDGNRIGYGGGFYDRFLQKVNAPKVGLIFEQNILSRIPTEPFDVPLDKIITERRIIENG